MFFLRRALTLELSHTLTQVGKAELFADRLGGHLGMGKDAQARAAGLAEPLLELAKPSDSFRQARIEQPGFEQRQDRRQAVAVSQRHRHLDEVAQMPVRLPAVADQSKNLP